MYLTARLRVVLQPWNQTTWFLDSSDLWRPLAEVDKTSHSHWPKEKDKSFSRSHAHFCVCRSSKGSWTVQTSLEPIREVKVSSKELWKSGQLWAIIIPCQKDEGSRGLDGVRGEEEDKESNWPAHRLI